MPETFSSISREDAPGQLHHRSACLRYRHNSPFLEQIPSSFLLLDTSPNPSWAAQLPPRLPKTLDEAKQRGER